MSFWKTLVEAIKGTETEYTKGSINRAIILLSIPMIIEMFGEGLFAIVDAYFVSKISNEAFATVIFTETIATLIYSISIGISIAASAMVARRIGEGDRHLAALAAGQAIWVALLISIIISFVGIFFAKDLLLIMGATDSVIEVGVPYMQIFLGSNIVILLLFILNGIFRGAGDASMSMRSLWIANLINIVLDPLFIFGIGPFPELGLVGAAVATTIGRGVAVLFQLYILFRGDRIIQLSKAYFTPQIALIKKIINLAITGAGQHLIASASWIFLIRIVSDYGTDTVNGYGLAIRIILFTLLPAWGIANAAATLIGQNLGAKEIERAEKSVWIAAKFNAIFLLLVSIIYVIWATPLLRLFNQDESVIEVGVECLRIFSISYFAFGVSMVISQAFGGAGDTRTPAIINLFSFWVLQIPLAYFLAKVANLGPTGVYWAVIISELIMALICVIWFKKGRWKTVEI